MELTLSQAERGGFAMNNFPGRQLAHDLQHEFTGWKWREFQHTLRGLVPPGRRITAHLRDDVVHRLSINPIIRGYLDRTTTRQLNDAFAIIEGDLCGRCGICVM